MANKRYYWLKLHDNFFTSKRIKKLRRLGADFVIIYLKMQLLSLQKNGKLVYSGLEENIASEIALEIDEDVDKVQLTMSYLQSCGLLECNEDVFFLPYVEKLTGSESDSAERTRNYRERKKSLESSGLKVLQRNLADEVPDFNTEKAWDDTFAIYPKKKNEFSAQRAWLDILSPVIRENQKDVAKNIIYGLKMYLEDYKKRNADDETFRYIPTFDKWLVEDATYWMRMYEKKINSKGGGNA